jgi:phage baseplate assembly protein W
MAIEIGKVNVADLKENNYKVLGIGINTTSNSNGIFAVNYTTLSQAKNNLINLILTRKGERVMQPEFGCDIWKLIFEQIDKDIIDSKIEKSINDAVSEWMPNINIDEIIFDYESEDIDRNTISLEMTFSLISNPKMRDNISVIVKQ